MTEIGLVTPQLAYVRTQLRFDGSRGADVAGQLRQHEGRWVVTAETLTAALGRAGVYIPPPRPPASQ